MKLAVGQMEPQICNPEGNLYRVKAILEEAEKENVHALVLPELCNSGYVFESMNEAFESSESIPEGPMSTMLLDWSSSHRLVVAGICERTKKGLYNSAAVFRNGKHVLTYRKIHLFLNEADWFLQGKEVPPVFEFRGYRFGVMVCFDWLFPEVTRVLALNGAQVILHPANLVLPYCQKAMVTRSIENRVFTATANRIGTEREVSFSGFSQITDIKGNLLCHLHKEEVGIASAEIDPKLADDKSITARNDVFGDRFPDLYKRITQDD
ncbi:MAG: nitrilase-related carbon-nitrogen hydrolase [Candidatus Thorarchaeota archaeon]